MSWHKKLNKIKDIPPDYKYQGYFWVSDEDKPFIISGELKLSEESEFFKYKETDSPFIVEAFLFSKDENISISIRHTSGRCYINQFMLNQLEKNKKNTVDKKYIAHKSIGRFLSAHKSIDAFLNFKEIWIPEKDQFCENMEVLKKQAVVFTGFE